MHAWYRRSDGYTLVEMIVVLSVIMMAVSFVVLNLTDYFFQLEVEALKDQIVQDLHYALHYADSKQTSLFLEFNSAYSNYSLRIDAFKKIFTRTYNPKIRIEHNFPNNTIGITKNGTVTHAGTITIKGPKKTYFALIVQLSTGVVREERY